MTALAHGRQAYPALPVRATSQRAAVYSIEARRRMGLMRDRFVRGAVYLGSIHTHRTPCDVLMAE